MAIVLGWIVFGAFIGLTLAQTAIVWSYSRFLRTSRRPSTNELYQPHVAVVLCLRGRDPSLEACLSGLASQDYKHYQVHIVVDDPDDPALEAVSQCFPAEDEEAVNVHVIDDHAANRSLKCSAILTAIEKLSDETEVVAFIDADTVADANWLRDLIQPLADPSVGATTGNRWFSPLASDTGSLVRQYWNAAAIAQMIFYQIPWGGSLAIRRSTIAGCELEKRWSTAFCEDTLLTDQLRRHGLTVVRVPDLIMCNQETSSLPDAFRWIVRQLLTVRLYHPEWNLVLVHGIFLGVCWISAWVSLGVSLATWDTKTGSVVVAAILIFNISNALLLRAIAKGNQRIVRERGQQAVSIKLFTATAWIGMFLTQALQPLAVLRTALTRKISWRGINYRIGHGSKVEMVRYIPYRDTAGPIDKSTESSID